MRVVGRGMLRLGVWSFREAVVKALGPKGDNGYRCSVCFCAMKQSIW